MAVDGGTNNAKGDEDPATRLPPDPAVHCAYVVAWVSTKDRWDLAADPDEVAALTAVLDACP